MLAEERKAKIVEYINGRNAVTALELMQEFQASEATIRRDLTDLDHKGLISKVHGGAVSLQTQILTDHNVAERESLFIEEKKRIAKYAASFIKDKDLVFLDAGTSTGYVINYITASDVTFVTNAVIHAQKLSAMGYKVYLTGGRLKSATEALVGPDCFESIGRFHFSVGFFGTNGISHGDGFTTPDLEEAKIKEIAMARTAKPYVLCDPSKFRMISSVRFAEFADATIITSGTIPESYREDSNILCI